jgi:hypothetical protein
LLSVTSKIIILAKGDTVTEAAQETVPKRRRKPKNQSLPVMKQLVDLMEQRTAIMKQLSVARMTVGQLENQLQVLAKEIEWRSSVLGIGDSGQTATPAPAATFYPEPVRFDPAGLTQPIFAQPPVPALNRDGVNRGTADLRSIS